MSNDCPYEDCPWPYWSYKCRIHCDDNVRVWQECANKLSKLDRELNELTHGMQAVLKTLSGSNMFTTNLSQAIIDSANKLKQERDDAVKKLQEQS